MGGYIFRKGRYADNPSLYVKTSRTERIEEQSVNYSPLQYNDYIDEIVSYAALEALEESNLEYIDSYNTSYSYNFPSNDELINGVLTLKGEERIQVLSPFAVSKSGVRLLMSNVKESVIIVK